MKNTIQIILDVIAIVDLIVAIIFPTPALFFTAVVAAGIAILFRKLNKQKDK